MAVCDEGRMPLHHSECVLDSAQRRLFRVLRCPSFCMSFATHSPLVHSEDPRQHVLGTLQSLHLRDPTPPPAARHAPRLRASPRDGAQSRDRLHRRAEHGELRGAGAAGGVRDPPHRRRDDRVLRALLPRTVDAVLRQHGGVDRGGGGEGRDAGVGEGEAQREAGVRGHLQE